jgi:hypothetical protein
MVLTLSSKVRRGRDRNVGEFTTTYAISPYHHEMCEFEYWSWRGVLYALFGDQNCQWLVAGRWFSTGIPVSFSHQWKWQPGDITKTLLKVALNTITLFLAIPYH